MTLGPSSLFSAALTLTLASSVLAGCAFGDVSGTGYRDPGSSSGSTDTNQPTANGGSNQSAAPTETSEDTGPIDYDALFDAPADPTTTDDLVTGLWAGKTTYAESRLLLKANKVVIALKCGESAATGMEVGAVVTQNQLKILASKTVGSSTYCEIQVSPIVIPRCSTDKTHDCFEISDSTLYFAGKVPFSSYASTTYSSHSSYTKLSD